MFKKIMVAFLCFAVSAKSISSVKVDLYTVTIPVASQSAADRTTAMKVALEDVLIKISGFSTVLDNEVVKQGLSKAADYVTQYSYQKNAEEALLLNVQFDRSALTALLSQAQISIWAEERPLVLVWLVGENGQIASAESDNELVVEMLRDAENRGLPLLFPTMDLQDVSSVSAKVILSDRSLPVDQASKRYHADAVLEGRIEKGMSVWRLTYSDQHDQWKLPVENPSVLADEVIGKTTDNLVSQFAVAENTTQDLLLDIHGVNSIEKYAEVLSYLKSINSVSQVSTSQVSKNSLQVVIRLNGSAQVFINRVQLDKQLLLEGAGSGSEDGDFIFQWIGGQ